MQKSLWESMGSKHLFKCGIIHLTLIMQHWYVAEHDIFKAAASPEVQNRDISCSTGRNNALQFFF